jgi:hypothetical protein
MENNELFGAWKNINSGIDVKTKVELNDILKEKVDEIINRDKYILIFSFSIGIGFILFLAAATALRWNDVYYRANNILLCLFVLYFQFRKVQKYFQLNLTNPDLSVKEWMKYRIDILSKWIYDQSVYFMLPFGFVFALMSVNVFIAAKPLVEVIQTESSIVSLFFGFIVGLSVAFMSVNKIRKMQLGNLKSLKDMYNQISA